MNILFIHCNYPAQFRSLATVLARESSHDVHFLTARSDAKKHMIPGLGISIFEDTTANEQLQPICQGTDQLIRRAHAVQQSLLAMRNDGFIPRLIIFHGGNGLGLLLKESCPEAALVGYFEWYFGPECAKNLLNSTSLSALAYTSLRNLVTNQEILIAHKSITPTTWQAQQFPEPIRQCLDIVFDGVDTSFFCPSAKDLEAQTVAIRGEAGDVTLLPHQPLLTYATRGMEPLRGFPEFMRALPQVLSELPTAQVLIGGRDRSAYGTEAPSHNGSWKQRILEELGDFEGRERIHFLGLMPYAHYLKMLQRTTLHCYFTRPFVTSWSFFEALACRSPLLTNQSAATTGLFPELEANAVSLDWPPSQLANAMIQGLKARWSEDQKPNLPQQYTLTFCHQQWQNVVNLALSQTAIS